MIDYGAVTPDSFVFDTPAQTGDPVDPQQGLDTGAPDPAGGGVSPPTDDDPCASLAGDPVSYNQCRAAWAARTAGATGSSASLGAQQYVPPGTAFAAALPNWLPTTSQQYWNGVGGLVASAAKGLGQAVGAGIAGAGAPGLILVVVIVAVIVFVNKEA